MSEEERGHIIDLIPALALGSLDAEDAERTKQHLATCATCQNELVVYQSVIDALPLAAADADPPPALKGRLMSRVRATSISETAASPASDSPWQQIKTSIRRFLAGPRWQPLALVVILALAVSNVLLWQQQNAPPTVSSRRFRLTATEVAPEATGIVYMSRSGREGTVIVDSMLPLPPDQQYQLWLIRDGERSSGGVFSVSDDGYHSQQILAPRPLEEYSAFGVTIEPAGGSPGPTGERVLGYNLDP